MEPYAEIAQQYADFAAQGRESPCFAHWSAGVVSDPEVQAWIASLPPVKHQPNIVFAAARWHGVPAPGPYHRLREALLGDDGSIRTTIETRSTQTNEVRRLATLLPAFALAVGDDPAPIALLEVGASAGLNLYPDRWSYRWQTPDGDVRLGEEGTPEQTCSVTGAAPLPSALPRIGWRGGIDLNPLDVLDEDAMAWLANLVWPEQDERRARLRVAIDVARADPPRLLRGDLLETLPGLVAEASAAIHGGPVIVFHSAVIAYLVEADRRRFEAMMAALVADGACSWVSNEGPRVLPGVTATFADATAPRWLAQGFVLGLDGRALAWTHGHGASMHWPT